MKTFATLSLFIFMSLPAYSQVPVDGEFQIMKACHVNATAMNLHGVVREHYLNNCVVSQGNSNKIAAEARKQCQISATAMNLAGDTRRHYLASCLASN